MMEAHRRYDISDEVWAKIEPHVSGQKGAWGGIAKNNRRFINGVFWILRTGVPWKDLPTCYGRWSNAHRRFIRWRNKGIWKNLLDLLIEEPNYQRLMIDASHIKVHSDAAGIPTVVAC